MAEPFYYTLDALTLWSRAAGFKTGSGINETDLNSLPSASIEIEVPQNLNGRRESSTTVMRRSLAREKAVRRAPRCQQTPSW